MKNDYANKLVALSMLLAISFYGKSQCIIPPEPLVYPPTVTPNCESICFTFASSGGSTSGLVIQYDDNAGFTSPTQVVLDDTSTVLCAAVAPGDTLWWRIRAIDCTGPCDCYSAYVPGEASGCNLASVYEPTDKIQSLLLSPNPADEQIRVHFDPKGKTARLQLFNAVGQQVLESDLHTANMELDISSLPRGVYSVQIAHENALYRSPLVVK